MITYFTKYSVIPGYGFPVDNVELYIYDRAKDDMLDEYNLSRNLSLAISEYAPGSEIIVDEKKYTSRYLMLPKNGYHLATSQKDLTYAQRYFILKGREQLDKKIKQHEEREIKKHQRKI